MRLLDDFSRRDVVGLTGVLAATLAVAACCLGVSSAAAEGVIRAIPVGQSPSGVSSDGTHVWVVNSLDNTVSEIEASSGTVIRTIPVGHRPNDVSSDGTRVWVVNYFEDTVSEIEAASGTVIRTIPVGHGPEGVSSDGTHVWVANGPEASVSEIEASSGTVIRTIPFGGLPQVVSSDGTHVWVTNSLDNTVSEIEASSGTVIRTISVGHGAYGVSSDGTHVWVVNDFEDTVSEIEASSGTVIRTIPVGHGPAGVSSDGTHVWVTNYEDNTVSEIEASSGTVIRTIPVGHSPYEVSSDGTHVWVTNRSENTVSEIPASYVSPPEASIESPASGGIYLQGAVVTTKFSCTEGQDGPGLESCTDSNGGSGTSGTLETLAPGPHTYTVTAKSKDGETGTASISYTVVAPPKAAIESPASGGIYLQGAVVTTKFSCTEGQDGPGLESCTDSNGASGTSGVLETSTLGPHTYTVTAKSKDGETGRASTSYTVVAETLEFGRCLKVAPSKGKYKTATCTTTTTKNSYEWYPAFGTEPLKERHFTTAIKSFTKLLLETTKTKERIYCTGQSGTGEYSGVKTVAGVILTLTGCYKGTSTDHCQSTNAEGEIVTNALGGQLGVVKTEAEASKDRLGLVLKAASGEVIAEFNCASTPVKLRGSVIVEVKANSMLSTMTLKYTQSKGVQKWTDFAGGTANEGILEAQVGEAGQFEQTGLALTTIQTNKEKLEVNSVV